MRIAEIDIRTTQGLKIQTDLGKNFSMLFKGFDNLDTLYTLTLKKDASEIVFAVGSSIVLNPGLKTLQLVFTGSDYTEGIYNGVLESNNKDEEYFYRMVLKLELEHKEKL